MPSGGTAPDRWSVLYRRGGRVSRSDLRSGTSLMEVVVALAILFIGLVPLLRLMSSQAVSAKDIRDYSVVMNLVEGQLHKYINMVNNIDGSDTLALNREDVTAEVLAARQGELKDLASSLKMFATVQKSTQCPDFAYDVQVEASWENGKTFQLFTVVIRRDPAVPGKSRFE
jgi:hypothetical protein